MIKLSVIKINNNIIYSKVCLQCASDILVTCKCPHPHMDGKNKEDNVCVCVCVLSPLFFSRSLSSLVHQSSHLSLISPPACLSNNADTQTASSAQDADTFLQRQEMITAKVHACMHAV